MNPESSFMKLIGEMQKFEGWMEILQRAHAEKGKSFWKGTNKSGARGWIPGWQKAEEAAFHAGYADAIAEVLEYLKKD